MTLSSADEGVLEVFGRIVSEESLPASSRHFVARFASLLVTADKGGTLAASDKKILARGVSLLQKCRPIFPLLDAASQGNRKGAATAKSALLSIALLHGELTVEDIERAIIAARGA